MDFIKAVNLCAIDCDKRSVIQNLEISVNLGVLQEQSGGNFKGGVGRGRFHSIELGADVIVTGDVLRPAWYRLNRRIQARWRMR